MGLVLVLRLQIQNQCSHVVSNYTASPGSSIGDTGVSITQLVPVIKNDISA